LFDHSAAKRQPNLKHEIDSTERLDLSLFGKLKALSLSKGSPTGLVAGRNTKPFDKGTL